MELKSCSVAGCYQKHVAKGFCINHYRRWKRYGDARGGRAENGEPMRWLEEHLKFAGEQCLFWPFAVSTNGYGKIQVGEETMNAHRYMCIRVHGDQPEGLSHSAHRCGNRLCVNPSHIRWASVTENCADRDAHGTTARAETSGTRKLTTIEAREIYSLYGKVKTTKLAEMYGVSRSTVLRISKKQQWSSVTE